MPAILPNLSDIGIPIDPPDPHSALFFDGTQWRVARVDDHGRVQVRGEDQIHSFAGVLAEDRLVIISGAGGYGDSDPCTAGEIWHVTNITAMNVTSPTTEITMDLRHDGVLYTFHWEAAAMAALKPWVWKGDLWLDPDDTVRAWFTGGLAGDSVRVRLVGEIMTLET